MDSASSDQVATNGVGFVQKETAVDPFLVEALQNPRHRLTILRMELDLQTFLQTPDVQLFQFQPFPTSYLRLAAHRVAQHYGLQTTVQDNIGDGQGRILVRKTPESKNPAVSLADVHAKQSENEKQDQIKIVLRPRPGKGSSSDNSELGLKRSSARTVEERKEEYDRARARIFNGPSSSEPEVSLTRTASDGKDVCLSADENEGLKSSLIDTERNLGSRDIGNSSRVAAIFRDREKDRSDPDYDRSYQRYVKNIPATPSFSLAPFTMQQYQPPYVQYDSVYPQLGQMPRAQASLNYRTPVMSPFCAMGMNQASGDALYMQWPMQSVMFAHSYDQLRHAVFQAPFCQQPLSFDYTQNHS